MSLTIATPTLPAMTPAAIERVNVLQSEMLKLPQVPIVTKHLIHAGMYHRTIFMPAGTALVGALVKIPTVLAVSGDALVYIGTEVRQLRGHNVIPASAGRKQAFVAVGDVHITMAFATGARTVEEAERQFTDEYALLMSHEGENEIVITGEQA